MREIEIKIPVPDPDRMRDKLGRIGAVARFPRSFEDNLIFDDERGTLKAAGRLLRLRSTRGRHHLTFKHPTERMEESGPRYKVRLEHETEVANREEVERIIESLGYRCTYRYQKYRQHYRLDEVSIVIDEIPFGCYIELEGEPASIDRAAGALGFGPGDYVTKTYYELHCEREGREPPGDLVFPTRS